MVFFLWIFLSRFFDLNEFEVFLIELYFLVGFEFFFFEFFNDGLDFMVLNGHEFEFFLIELNFG